MIGTTRREQEDCTAEAPDEGWVASTELGAVHDSQCWLVKGRLCSFSRERCGGESCRGPGIAVGASIHGPRAGSKRTSDLAAEFEVSDGTARVRPTEYRTQA